MHGKTAPVRHEGDALFEGVPSPVDGHPVPLAGDGRRVELHRGARAHRVDRRRHDDPPEIQGVRHRTRPVWGVQFHPESHFSQAGKRLLANFLEA